MRYLSKSRFKIGCECPTKLYYGAHREYYNAGLEDPFLKALAEGGYQVGELAKAYHPGGINIDTLDSESALAQTTELMKRDRVVLFEPAFAYKNLLVRVDVLIKEGDRVDLIEVKAKSVDPQNPGFMGKKGGVSSAWKPYLYDVAFQRYVLTHARPDLAVQSFLMLADKSATAIEDGLNQRFPIARKADGSIEVTPGKLTDDERANPLLAKIPTDAIVDEIWGDEFEQLVWTLADARLNDRMIAPSPGSHCAGCEFSLPPSEQSPAKKSGFHECWKSAFDLNDDDFLKPLILEVWNTRQKNRWIEEGKLFIEQLDEAEFSTKPSDKPGLTPADRQWLQVQKVREADDSVYFDAPGFALQMASWRFPLHCIDFETTRVALPFTQGSRPYEGVAFQFSHHVLHEDGRVEHAGEFLDTRQGVFPNFDFVRELKRQLEADEGTVFCYSQHENSFLNEIDRQLAASAEPDKEALSRFIRSITRSSGSSRESWLGDRCMVDLWDLVKRYFYDPRTHGSNSIKYVLPAVLNRSAFLQAKYSQPIYGTPVLPSRNFTNWRWIELDESGRAGDPYRRLPKLFSDLSDEENEKLLSGDDELRNGGAALTAYARMQFSHMSEAEKEALSAGLKRYCELDTLAMVMILEGWMAARPSSEQGFSGGKT
jgi:hypothetical protein